MVYKQLMVIVCPSYQLWQPLRRFQNAAVQRRFQPLSERGCGIGLKVWILTIGITTTPQIHKGNAPRLSGLLMRPMEFRLGTEAAEEIDEAPFATVSPRRKVLNNRMLLPQFHLGASWLCRFRKACCEKTKKKTPSISLSLRNWRVERIVEMKVVARTSLRMRWIATEDRRLISGLDQWA